MDILNRARHGILDRRELFLEFEQHPNAEKRIPYRYYHPKDHEEVEVLAHDFAYYVDQLKGASFDPNFRGLYHTVRSEIVGTRPGIECDFALAAISTNRLSNIEADLGLDQFETGDVDVSYGVHLAIDGMPTGLRIDNWDNKGGYLKRYFVVVNADMSLSTQLDPGRKGISRYYARMISDRAIDLLNSSKVDGSDPFARYASKYLSHGRGREIGGLPSQDFKNKIDVVLQQAEEKQAGEEQLLSKLATVSSFTHVPVDEQEVVALFYELLTQQIVKGYKTVYLGGSRAVYDAALEYEISCNATNVYPQDLVGIGKVIVQDLRAQGLTVYKHREHHRGLSVHPELCVDFKKDIGEFLSEVILRSGRTNKNPGDIDLIIVWDDDIPPAIPQTSYSLARVPDNRRIYHGTTQRLGLTREYNTEIDCIVLKDIVSGLEALH